MNSTTNGFKAALKTPANIILVTLAVTAIAFIESLRSFIWSPFIIVHTDIDIDIDIAPLSLTPLIGT